MALTLLFLCVFFLAFMNGANDVSKGVATLVATGDSSYEKALVWGASWTAAGAWIAAFVSQRIVSTFLKFVQADPSELGASFFISVIAGAVSWLLFATWRRMPVSTTHAILGGFTGAAIALAGWNGVNWSPFFKKAIVPLAVSPLIGVLVAAAIFPLIRRFESMGSKYCLCWRKTERFLAFPQVVGNVMSLRVVASFSSPEPVIGEVDSECCDVIPQKSHNVSKISHWLSAGFTSFSRGLNDAPKMAVLLFALPALHQNPMLAYATVALAMGLGSYLFGRRVTQTLSQDITTLKRSEGLATNAATAFLVGVASHWGWPVSTTHVSCGALVGSKTVSNRKDLHWQALWGILKAWLYTIPMAALVAWLAFSLLA